jgi:hypothetical protein
MSDKLKSFLIVAAKQAIIGGSTIAVSVFEDPAKFNLATGAGWAHVLVMVGTAVATREALVWGPKLLAWANS